LLIRVNKGAADRKGCWLTFGIYGDGEDNSEYDSKGIAWSVMTAGPGSSSPVIVGDKIFITCEDGCLQAINKRDGKKVWTRTLTYYDFATQEERNKTPSAFTELDPIAAKLRELDKTGIPAVAARAECENKLMKGMLKVDAEKYNWAAGWGCEAGFTAGNPVTDGKYVYVLYGTGITACFDLEGKLIWSRLLKHVSIEHGYTTSPLLIDGKLVIYTDDFNVLDAKTGKSLITKPHFVPNGGKFTNWYQHFHAGGVTLTAGKEKVLYYMNGEFVRLSDGKTLNLDKQKLNRLKPINWTEGAANRISTPLVENNICYKLTHNTGTVAAFTVPAISGSDINPDIKKEIVFNTDKFAYYYESFYDAAQLLHEGLLYCLNTFGTLTVLDVEKGTVLYQKQLDLEIHMPYSSAGTLKGGASAAPTLAGKYIYIFGNQGACLVLEPGRVYKQIAKLKIENVGVTWPGHQDTFMTNPIFEGERIYYRSEGALWCIGRK
ncbi:MAG: PQQ-binding-like beta-propeller repeat protein, partial [Candidatus Firestonebacteria bacterium]